MQSICSTHRLPEVLPSPVLQRGPVGHASNSATAQRVLCTSQLGGERAANAGGAAQDDRSRLDEGE